MSHLVSRFEDKQEAAPLAWVLDDQPDQARALSESLAAVGFVTKNSTDIDELLIPIDEVVRGQARLPNLIIIDQHW